MNSVGKKSKRVAAMLENGIKEGLWLTAPARIETGRGRFKGERKIVDARQSGTPGGLDEGKGCVGSGGGE